MKLELTTKQFRRLLDMAYIGNWILNSTRGDDRFQDYDQVESLLFAKARELGMTTLAEDWQGEVVPSRAFAEGGIHEAIMEYENNVFFDILAEDLARRDMDDAPIDESNYDELTSRIDAYIAEFEQHGTDNILVDSDQRGPADSAGPPASRRGSCFFPLSSSSRRIPLLQAQRGRSPS